MNKSILELVKEYQESEQYMHDISSVFSHKKGEDYLPPRDMRDIDDRKMISVKLTKEV